MASGNFTFEQVKQHALFQSLDDHEWQTLTTFLTPRRFQPAQVIFEEGDSTNDMYLLLSGIVELRRQFIRYPGDYWLATLNAGRVFGEASLLSTRRRVNTAIALTQVETAVLPSRNIDRIPLELRVKLHRAWGEMMGERLYILDDVLIDVLEQRGADSAAKTMVSLYQRFRA